VAARFGSDPRVYLTTGEKFAGDEDGNVKELHIYDVEWAKNEQGAFIPKRVRGTDKVLQADLVLLAMGFLGPEDAVRKMTSMPAQVLGLKDRGLLREGYWGDVVVLDPDTVADTATYDNPKQYPKGIPYVLVNGAVVIDNGHHTGARPGRVVYGPGKRIA